MHDESVTILCCGSCLFSCFVWFGWFGFCLFFITKEVWIWLQSLLMHADCLVLGKGRGGLQMTEQDKGHS